MEGKQLSQRIQSVEVGFHILRRLAEAERPLTITQLAQLSEMHKSKLYRYLNSFVQLGILEQNKEDLRYSFGPELISLGLRAMGKMDVLAKSTPYLLSLKEELNETVALSIWGDHGPFFIKWEESNRLVNIGVNAGSYVPLHSATGMIFRAFLPEWVTDAIYHEEVEKGMIDPAAYAAIIQRVQKEYFAWTECGFIAGISAISAPIFDATPNDERRAATLRVVYDLAFCHGRVGP